MKSSSECLSEKNLKIRVLKMIRSEFPGAWAVKLSDMWISGIPDFVIIYMGSVMFVELKTERGVVSKIQEYTMGKIREAGGNAFVARSVEDIRKRLKEISHEPVGTR